MFYVCNIYNFTYVLFKYNLLPQQKTVQMVIVHPSQHHRTYSTGSFYDVVNTWKHDV